MSVELSLDSLGRDGLSEIFDEAVSEILGNILDPNTEPKKVRKLTVEVAFKPDENRSFPEVTYSVKKTLVGVRPATVTAMVTNGQDGETLHIPEVGTDPAQHELPTNVSNMEDARNAQ